MQPPPAPPIGSSRRASPSSATISAAIMPNSFARLDFRLVTATRGYVMSQNPAGWDPIEPADDAQKQQVFDELADALSEKMQDLATRRVRAERMLEWQTAFNQSGRGSSYVCASVIGERIFDRAAPIPDVVPTIDRNSFLRDVAGEVESVCQKMGARLH
jgi:hypothetical protein